MYGVMRFYETLVSTLNTSSANTSLALAPAPAPPPPTPAASLPLPFPSCLRVGAFRHVRQIARTPCVDDPSPLDSRCSIIINDLRFTESRQLFTKSHQLFTESRRLFTESRRLFTPYTAGAPLLLMTSGWLHFDICLLHIRGSMY
jgi:hypothetical protein